MYAQHIRRQDIPSNYSGNAFRYPPIGSLVGQDTHQEGQGGQVEEQPRQGEGEEQRTVAAVVHLPDEKDTRERQASAQASVLPFFGEGRGFGSEELLLIGLILLLSGGGHAWQGSDVLPYLLLLLILG